MVTILRRITCEETILSAKAIWDAQTAEDIAANALQILAKASNRKITFFNGKTPKCILGGLFYILGYRIRQEVTERRIANSLGATEVSIRKSYSLWLSDFPDLFTDVILKMHNKNRNMQVHNKFTKNFDTILLESVDEAFSCIGENAKKSVYFHLENTFKIFKTDIAFRIDDFSEALHALLGSGAQHLEIIIMKKLHEKTCCQHKWEGPKWLLPDLTFTKYVTLVKIAYENRKKPDQLEVTIDAKEKQVQYR